MKLIQIIERDEKGEEVGTRVYEVCTKFSFESKAHFGMCMRQLQEQAYPKDKEYNPAKMLYWISTHYMDKRVFRFVTDFVFTPLNGAPPMSETLQLELDKETEIEIQRGLDFFSVFIEKMRAEDERRKLEPHSTQSTRQASTIKAT